MAIQDGLAACSDVSEVWRVEPLHGLHVATLLAMTKRGITTSRSPSHDGVGGLLRRFAPVQEANRR